MPGQIIVVSGTSGSGKSTTCELYARRSEEFWLLYGIDHFMAATFPAKFGHHGARARAGVYAHPLDEGDPDGSLRWSFGPHGLQAFRVFHDWIASASLQGCNIIVDHLMMVDPPVLQDAIWRLKGLPVLFVVLKPPYAVLEQRIAARSMGGKSSTQMTEERAQAIRSRLDRLRAWFYQASYANDCCDLTINTVEHGPDATCDLIDQRLANGAGTAFEDLRQRYAQPESRD
jgi:chloramphenicol 3-O-phosphotransferase